MNGVVSPFKGGYSNYFLMVMKPSKCVFYFVPRVPEFENHGNSRKFREREKTPPNHQRSAHLGTSLSVLNSFLILWRHNLYHKEKQMKKSPQCHGEKKIKLEKKNPKILKICKNYKSLCLKVTTKNIEYIWGPLETCCLGPNGNQ